VLTMGRRTALFVAANTIGAACLLPIAPPAQADGCDEYAFPDTPDVGSYDFPVNVELVQDNGIHVFLQTSDTQAQQAAYKKIDGPDPADLDPLFYGVAGVDPFVATTGIANGGITGRTINFKVKWRNQFTNVYTGQVNDDGSASGTTINNTGTTNTWHSAFADFRCVPAPPPVPRKVDSPFSNSNDAVNPYDCPVCRLTGN
jgi:hypothetical protein